MSNVGRPTVMTEETIAKLEEAFLNGATDREACFIAGISDKTLYNYGDQYPEFLQRKEDLKNMVKYQARKNVASAINAGDKLLSQWFLERRDKDFNPKSQVELGGKMESALTLNDAQYQELIRLGTQRINRETGSSEVVQ